MVHVVLDFKFYMLDEMQFCMTCKTKNPTFSHNALKNHEEELAKKYEKLLAEKIIRQHEEDMEALAKASIAADQLLNLPEPTVSDTEVKSSVAEDQDMNLPSVLDNDTEMI